MAEKRLSEQTQTRAKPPRWLVIVGAIVLVLSGIFLLRQPIAEGVARLICSQQGLACTLKVSRLDLSGITLRDVDVKSAGQIKSALSAREMRVDLGWASPVSVRTAEIAGDGLAIRLDLTGARPVLGDLDRIMRAFAGEGDPAGGPPPRIDIADLRVIADTLMGLVEARGHVRFESMETFDVALTVTQTRLSGPAARIDLARAEINAVADDGAIVARAHIDLARLESPETQIDGLITRIDLKQGAEALTATGSLQLAGAEINGDAIGAIAAEAQMEAPPVDIEAATLEGVVTSLQAVVLNASADAGGFSGARWDRATLSLSARRNEAGAALLKVENFVHPAGGASLAELSADLMLSESSVSATGLVRLEGAGLSEAARTDIVTLVRETGAVVFPSFSSAAAELLDQATLSFAASLPWAIELEDSQSRISLLSGAQARSASGAVLELVRADEAPVATLTGGGATAIWAAGGELRLSGQGAPNLTVHVEEAAGDDDEMRAAGGVELKPWRVGGEVLALTLRDASFSLLGEASALSRRRHPHDPSTGLSGSASGNLALSLSGAVGGGVWDGAEASGQVSATWTHETFAAEAPTGLALSWREARYGETVIGAGGLRYRPTGLLAEVQEDGLTGAGVLSAAQLPLSGAAFTARAALGPVNVDWNLDGALNLAFDAEPLEVVLMQSGGPTPMRVADISGRASFGDSWKVSGRMSGGVLQAQDVDARDIVARFELGGAGGRMDGRLDDLTMRLIDPKPDAEKRYESLLVTGRARLADSIADFSAEVTLAASGVQLARIAGHHDPATAAGSLEFAPTPLIFIPRVFEPSALSPLLRGPANVRGRVDVSGGATWSPEEGLKARANAKLSGLGFAIASAGVFEGVSGEVEVSDLLAVTSPPGQELRVERVTLGMPLENGIARFQLTGLEALRLEGISWPFAGGEIKVRETDFVFGAASNRVEAEAVNWDLRTIVEQFKIPDVRVQGKVNGVFPVVFSTGSAEVDNAILQASQPGGVIQYSGAPADAAGQADSNAKMLFDALRDFHYQVLQMELDGDLAGNMELKLTLRGANPAFMGGQAFDLNIAIDSPLVDLLNMTSRANTEVDAVVDAIVRGRN